MASPDEAEYNAFLEKVRRTVFIDHMTPHLTKPVLKQALDQFGTVKSVQFIPNYLYPKEIWMSALVEMESEEMAKAVISMLTQFPFMVAGMPRPVRARAAEPRMFDGRPKKPGRKIYCRWMDPNDPDFETAKKLKQLVRKHNAEASFILKKQLEQEDKLAQQQTETLKANDKKFKLIDDLLVEGVAQALAGHYNMKSLVDR